MNKHTPGPWSVSELDAKDEPSKYYIFVEPGVAVIERKVDGSNQCDMPDARLIAASPDMLAALQTAGEEVSRLAAFLVGYGDAADLAAKKLRALQPIIDAAVLKATGEAT